MAIQHCLFAYFFGPAELSLSSLLMDACDVGSMPVSTHVIYVAHGVHGILVCFALRWSLFAELCAGM